MLTRLQLSLKLIKESTNEFLSFLNKEKVKESQIRRNINKKEDEKEIKRIKEKLGI